MKTISFLITATLLVSMPFFLSAMEKDLPDEKIKKFIDLQNKIKTTHYICRLICMTKPLIKFRHTCTEDGEWLLINAMSQDKIEKNK